MSDYKDDEVDIEPYEGTPDFTSSEALDTEGTQDDKEVHDA